MSWLVGPEQNRSQMLDGVNNRFVVDTTIVYTGIERWTFAVSVRNVGGRGLAPTSDAQNTITFALYYSFF